jgi:hypothetical protein
VHDWNDSYVGSPDMVSQNGREVPASAHAENSIGAIVSYMTTEERHTLWGAEGFLTEIEALREAIAANGVDYEIRDIIEQRRPMAESALRI